jgi:hypothetical protein
MPIQEKALIDVDPLLPRIKQPIDTFDAIDFY